MSLRKTAASLAYFQSAWHDGRMKIYTFVGGPVQTNGYLVGDGTSGEAMVVDPPFDCAEQMLARARAEKMTIKYIVNTHGHFDHIGDNAALKKLTGAEILCHADERPMLENADQMKLFGMDDVLAPTTPDRCLAHGDTLAVGTLSFSVAHCPGHSNGHIVLYEAKEKVCFCGDVIFAGSVGRTDLPGGSWETLADSIRKNILSLPDDTRLHCGHGPVTTVGREKKTNPFVEEILAGS
jgi:glyoxylase-like metal-dependent hydrolase (beta-lactamase superfamily II)